MNKLSLKVILPLALLINLLMKIPAFFNPMAGYFGSYQAVNAMMAGMMGPAMPIAWLVPHTFLLTGGSPSSHLLYYPFASFFAAVMHVVFSIPLDFSGRFQAALFMLLSALVFFRFVKSEFDRHTAVLSAVIFCFSPMAVVMGVSFQNEAIALFFLVSAYAMLVLEKPSAVLAGALFALAVIARIHFVVIFPAFVFTVYVKHRENFFSVFVRFVVPLTIVASAWYLFMCYWELNHNNVMTGFFGQVGEGRLLLIDFLKKPDFWLKLAKTFVVWMLTPVLLPFFFIGLSVKNRGFWIYFTWIACAFSICFLLPKKTFDHPFYLLALLPPLSVFCALGLQRVLSTRPKIQSVIVFAFALSAVWISKGPLTDFTVSEKHLRQFGKEIQSAAPEGAKIIASSGTSCDLLFYSNRFGWTFDLDMRREGHETQDRIVKKLRSGYGDLIVWLEYLRSQGAGFIFFADADKLTGKPKFKEHLDRNYQRLDLVSDNLTGYKL